MYITQISKKLIQSKKRRACLSILQELKKWTVKVLNVQGAHEFVLLIAKKQPNNNHKAFLVS